jgi:molybdopterin-guanine dinucleotide biosynthesis protein A
MFVEQIVEVARAVVDEVVLLGDSPLSAPALGDLVQLKDEPDLAGPLAGLVPLLEYARDRWALLIACDMPLIEPRVLQHLIDACDETCDAAAYWVVEQGAGYHPCCVVFHPRTAVAARSELCRSASLRELIGGVRCRVLEASAFDARCLTNVNTPDDYASMIGSSASLIAAEGSFG